MMTYLVGYGGIALIAGVVVLLDYIGRRQPHKARKATRACSSSPHADDFWP